MASSTQQPAAEFYEWALDRYQRRSTVLARILIVVITMTIAALVVAGLFLNEVRELRTQTQTTSATVERLHDRLRDARAASDRKTERLATRVDCLEAQSRKYADGVARLLRRKIAVDKFVRKYEPKDCR